MAARVFMVFGYQAAGRLVFNRSLDCCRIIASEEYATDEYQIATGGIENDSIVQSMLYKQSICQGAR